MNTPDQATSERAASCPQCGRSHPDHHACSPHDDSMRRTSPSPPADTPTADEGRDDEWNEESAARLEAGYQAAVSGEVVELTHSRSCGYFDSEVGCTCCLAERQTNAALREQLAAAQSRIRELEAMQNQEQPEPRCGFCGTKLTLVRPGSHQCDNPKCESNQ